MTQPKQIAEIKGDTQLPQIFDDLKEFAGPPEEEQAIANSVIKNFRTKRFEDYKRIQYHTNYKDFATPLKEKNIVKPEEITAKRRHYFEMYCQESIENKHIKFAGSSEQEDELVFNAIKKYREARKMADKLKNYCPKAAPKKTEYKQYTTTQYFDYITTERADQIFGKYTTGKLVGQSKFKLDNQARHIITPLCEYFTNNPDFEERFFLDTIYKNPAHPHPDEIVSEEKIMFSLDKGILLFSECGYGKTDTMRLFNSNPRQSFMVINCLTAEEDFSIEGDDGIRKYYNLLPNPNPTLFFGHEKFGILFDNLGLEKQGKYYGSPEEVMEKILFQIYHRKAETAGKIHLTTNFSRQYIKERYGPAVYSRFFEMFNFLTFPAGSIDRRKQL